MALNREDAFSAPAGLTGQARALDRPLPARRGGGVGRLAPSCSRCGADSLPVQRLHRVIACGGLRRAVRGRWSRSAAGAAPDTGMFVLAPRPTWTVAGAEGDLAEPEASMRSVTSLCDLFHVDCALTL
jgi:hypothetical protein